MNLYGGIIACIYPCKIRIAKLLLSSREGLSLNAYNDIMLQEYEIKDIFNGDEPGFCVFRKYKIAPMQTAKKDLGSWEISVTASIENYIEIALYEDKIGAEKPIYLSFDGDLQPDNSHGVVEFNFRKLFSDPSCACNFTRYLEESLSFRVPGLAEILQDTICDKFGYFKRQDINSISALLSSSLQKAPDELGFVCFVFCIAFQLIVVNQNYNIENLERVLSTCESEDQISYESIFSALSN